MARHGALIKRLIAEIRRQVFLSCIMPGLSTLQVEAGERTIKSALFWEL